MRKREDIKKMLLQQFELLAEKSKSEEADIYECTLAMCEIARYLDACEIKIIRQSANRIRFPWYLRWMHIR